MGFISVIIYVGFPSIARNGDMRGIKQTLCSILNVLLFSEVNSNEIKASVTLVACCCFYITIL